MSYDNLGIGKENKEDQLKPELVEVLDYEIALNVKVGKNMLTLVCKHPQREIPIRISTCLVKNEGRTEAQGLWITLDKEGSIPFYSGVAKLLRLHECEALKDIKGKIVMLEKKPESIYLAVRAY